MEKILVIHGPNMNLLGLREKSIYGQDDLASIDDNLKSIAHSCGYQLEAKQSNAEHTLIDWIHQSVTTGVKFLVINAAAFTHTSLALRDALLAVNLPFIEVHITNVFSREGYREHSYLADIAAGVISGLGSTGYELAVRAAISKLQTSPKNVGT